MSTPEERQEWRERLRRGREDWHRMLAAGRELGPTVVMAADEFVALLDELDAPDKPSDGNAPSDVTIAREYEFKHTGYPTINGERIPWLVSTKGPRVEPLDDGQAFHLLWVPFLVEAPMPPMGSPAGEPLLIPGEEEA